MFLVKVVHKLQTVVKGVCVYGAIVPQL